MIRGAHEGFEGHQPVDALGDRKFGLTLGALLIAVGGVRWALGHFGLVTAMFAGAGLVLIVLGWLAPALLGPFNRAWMKLGALMAAIVNPIIMLAMFVFVFTPVALIMRWCGRDGLARRPKSVGETYWHETVKREEPRERFRHQF